MNTPRKETQDESEPLKPSELVGARMIGRSEQLIREGVIALPTGVSIAPANAKREVSHPDFRIVRRTDSDVEPGMWKEFGIPGEGSEVWQIGFTIPVFVQDVGGNLVKEGYALKEISIPGDPRATAGDVSKLLWNVIPNPEKTALFEELLTNLVAKEGNHLASRQNANHPDLIYRITTYRQSYEQLIGKHAANPKNCQRETPKQYEARYRRDWDAANQKIDEQIKSAETFLSLLSDHSAVNIEINNPLGLLTAWRK